MPNYTKVAGRVLGAAAIAGWLGACNFIDHVPGNENHIQNAAIGQLLTSIQLETWLFNEGHVARLAQVWMNEQAGIDRQMTALDQYDFTEDEVSGEMAGIYTGGGLADIRKAEAKADSQGATHTSAVLKIHEAFDFGMAASMWGAIPYSTALGDQNATLDPQEQVYAAVQTLLDQAITQLTAAAGSSDPGILVSRDMSFGGDATAWRRVANSLKARYYMHWVEAQAAGSAAANTACGGNCLAKALAAAQNGINSASGDWQSYHSTTATETNWWYQFNVERSGYMGAGYTLVNLMNTTNDPRRQYYFGTNSPVGSKPGESNGSATPLNTDNGIAAPDAGIPLITCAETQFIIAEAQYRLGNQAAALTALNAGIACAYARAGLAAPAPMVGLTGAALLTAIEQQKYIALFLNMEVWNDWKRNCYPNLTTVKQMSTLTPGRLLYGQAERSTNSNIPSPAQQPARNANDPNPCPGGA